MQRLDRHRELIASLGVRGWLTLVSQSRSADVAKRMNYTLRSRDARYPLHYRPGESDLEAFNQIFIFREYKSIDSIGEGGLIIDCGANVGYSSAWFLSKFPAARVIAVEPDAGNFEMLQRNLEPFGDRATAVHGAIWSRETGLTFEERDFRDRLSWSVRVREVAPGEKADVKGYDIPSLMRMAGAERIALLKVDIERGEIELFGGSPSTPDLSTPTLSNPPPWISRCDNIVIELHDEECERVFFAATEGQGFSVRRDGEIVICTRT